MGYFTILKNGLEAPLSSFSLIEGASAYNKAQMLREMINWTLVGQR